MADKKLDPVEALGRLGGIASPAEVARMSSRKRLRTALRKGRVVRVDRHRVSLAGQAHARLAARDAGAHLSHVSAAREHGWEVLKVPELPQVTRDPRRDAPPAGGETRPVELFERRLSDADRGAWATTRLRTVLDCARDLPFDEALAVADSALRHRSVSEAQLLAATAGLAVSDPRRRVAEYADARAANPFESALRAECIEVDLPVVPQYEVVAGDLTLHPDLANPLLGLAIEADSYAHHGMRPWDHERDCTRYNALVVAGWVVLRFTWEQVVLQPAYVRQVLRDWVAAAA